MDLNVFINAIHEECNKNSLNHNVPIEISRELFKYVYWDQGWWMNYDEPVYVIGLSEDNYDFYWVAINNKEKKLKFITYLYSFDKCDYVTKKWSTDEKKDIEAFVKKYFEEHPKENLIDFHI